MNIFYLQKKYQKVSRFVVVLVLAIALLAPSPKKAEAFGLPFGGLITSMTYCTCSFNFLVALSLPRPGLYVYSPYSTLLFMDYAPLPGSWLLGRFIPGVQACWMYAGLTCFPVPNLGTIIATGTSL